MPLLNILWTLDLKKLLIILSKDKSVKVGKDLILKDVGKFPISQYNRHKDYFISYLPASSFLLYYSDDIIKSREATFVDNSMKERIIKVRDNMNQMDNPVIIYAKIEN